MKKVLKKIMEESGWVIIALIDIAIIGVFFYMIFGWVLEIAEFRVIMNTLAGLR